MNGEKEVTPTQGKSSINEEPKPKSPELSKIMIVGTEQIDAKLAKLKGVLPTLLLNRLSESLKMTRVTEAQCDEIIMRTVDQFQNSGKANQDQISEIFQKLENLDSSILSLVQFLEQAYGAGANPSPASAQQKELVKVTQNTETQQKEPPKDLPKIEVQETPKSLPENEKTLKQNNPASDAKENDCTRNSAAAENPAGALQQTADGNPVVRLTHIDNKIENEIVMLKWIEFLLERVGREYLPRTLEFYEDIGWINAETVDKILTYARGVNVSRQEGYTKELGVKDHIQSLLFIEKLRGCEVEKQSIISLEKEIVAIKRGSEGIYGI